MDTRATYPPGAPYWVALLAPDTDVARRFYSSMFGWSYENIASDGEPPFYIASRHGRRVASIGGPESPGTWISAVSVPDLNAATRAAVEAGGTAPGPAIEIRTLGRFQKLEDPAGAEIHLVEPLDDRAAARVEGVGAWSASSLEVIDPASVAPFYESLFGQRLESAGSEAVFRLPAPVGDAPHDTAHGDVVVRTTPASTGSDATWTYGFEVVDADASARTALAEGGRMLGEPADAAGFRTAVLSDPGGARFSVSHALGG